MFGLSRLQAYLAAGLIGAALVLGGVAWLRWDAIQDDRQKRQAEYNERRLQQIEEDRSRDNEIRDLDDRGLIERAQRWLRPDDTD